MVAVEYRRLPHTHTPLDVSCDILCEVGGDAGRRRVVVPETISRNLTVRPSSRRPLDEQGSIVVVVQTGQTDVY